MKIAKKSASKIPDIGFLRKKLHVILIWPAACLLAGVLLWIIASAQVADERKTAEEQAYKRAVSLANSYSEQLTRSVEHFDQITRNVKYYWELTNGNTRLEEELQHGLYPEAPHVFVSIAGPNGELLSSTLPMRPSFNYAQNEWFQLHRTGQSKGMVIAASESAYRTGQPVVRFTRRLETEDGTFDGVVFVSVEPDYLITFYDGAALGENDFLTLRLTTGLILATKVGNNVRPAPVFYRENPVFDQASGVIEEPGEKFIDKRQRIVAWEKVEQYPLIALAGLSKANAFAGYDTIAKNFRNFATVGSVFLLLFAITGMLLTARLAWRHHKADEIERTYLMAVDAANEGFYMIRPLYDERDEIADFQIEDCNERGASLAGYSKEQLIGEKISELQFDSSIHDEISTLHHAMDAGFYEDEMRVPLASRINASWIYRRLVRTGAGLAITVRDITESKAHEQAMSDMANADALTGLPNRHWLKNYLPTAVTQAAHNSARLAVLFIDLDDFKNINDTLGHAAGDELLKTVAKRLRSLVRTSDHVVRLGGDEFTIILEQLRHTEDVSRLAQLIIKSVGEPVSLGLSTGQRVHSSIGISVFPQDGQDGDTLLKHADIAMYAAKAAGKGRYHFYESHLSDRLIVRINKEQALQRAIERDEFVLHYQPRVDTFSGRMSSMEALVRWEHPDLGLIQPLEFIQVAEDTRLILEIGSMVIDKACAQLAQWKAQGLPLVPVSVNVSALQFNDGNMKSILAAAMRKHDIDPALIGVELTESCMIGEDETVSQKIDAVRGLGIKLLVDDFGTGYSSLSQLQRLDVDILKVDRAFTVSLCNGEEGKAFYKAIIAMAAALDMCIVAEGVETEDQLHELQALSCDEIQGHFISRPVPGAEMGLLLVKGFLFPPAIPQDSAVVI